MRISIPDDWYARPSSWRVGSALPEPSAATDALPVSSPELPAVAPTFDVHALVEPDLWETRSPPASRSCSRCCPTPTSTFRTRWTCAITRPSPGSGPARAGPASAWCAPGVSQKALGFDVVDWRDGWCSWNFAPSRTAQPFANQLDHRVARSKERGRIAIVLLDNAKIHTPQGAKVVREAVARHGDRLRLVPTPAYDPRANPAELLFRPFRRAVTHNHHRDDVVDLFRDAFRYVEDLDAHPERALRHIGSPVAIPASGCGLT